MSRGRRRSWPNRWRSCSSASAKTARTTSARSTRPRSGSGGGPTANPAAIVLEAAARYGLAPLLVHSTSWRHQEGRLILTYVAAVGTPQRLSEYLTDEPVGRADLARGDALGPPTDIDVTQVLEHAFRHLSWLVKDDAVVGDALVEWVSFLDRYEPEPFRAFGPAPG